jgi:hypothetical protein
MASTRNKNAPSDYCLEQNQNKNISDHRTYIQRRTAYHNALPCAGINVGYMPNNVLSHNATDVESFLYGVNSTNLVKPRAKTKPELKQLPDLAFFERPQIFLPEPLVIEKNQRPHRP